MQPFKVTHDALFGLLLDSNTSGMLHLHFDLPRSHRGTASAVREMTKDRCVLNGAPGEFNLVRVPY